MNTFTKLTVLGCALTLSSYTYAKYTYANDKLEETVVTSSRIEMPLRQVATAVTVLTEQDIKDLGLNSLGSVLSTQAGIGISRNGGVGSASSLRIRGEEGFRTLVFIDGMDISDTSGVQIGPNFDSLLSNGVSRVEVLRGPQGMMYGADAGGVINITSFVPEDEFGGEISAETGRYDTQVLSGSIGGKNDTGDFSLTATDYATDGFNSRITAADIQDDDGYGNTTVQGRSAWNVSDRLRLQVTLRNIDSDNDYDSCDIFDENFNQIPFDLCNNTLEQTSGRVSAEYKGERLTHLLAASGTEIDREFFQQGLSSFVAHGELEKYEYLGSFVANESSKFVYGAELKTEAMEDGGNTYDRDQTGLYAEYQGNVNDALYLTAGARYDDNDDFGDFTSYRVSAAYLVDVEGGTLKLKSSFGTGFRAPSLFEISYNNGPFAYPPASQMSLSQEESQGFDLGIEYFADNGSHLEAVYFDQRVQDEIFFDLVNFSGYLQGDGETESTGLELIGEAPVTENWFLHGNYTYNTTENASGSNRLRRPQHLLNLGVRFTDDSGRFSANLYVRGSYEAIDIDESELDDYEVVNLSANFQLTEAFEIFGRVENLLDEAYQEVPTYNTSEVAGYAGIRYSF